MFNHKQIYQSDVRLALSEDLRDKDLSDGIIKDQIVTAFLKAKDDGLFCGQDWFEESFKQIDKNIDLDKKTYKKSSPIYDPILKSKDLIKRINKNLFSIIIKYTIS